MMDLDTRQRQARDLARHLYEEGTISQDHAATLMGALDEALARAELFGAQLGGWEAEAATMYNAIERVLDTCPFCRGGGPCQADTHRWLRAAIAPTAGQHLLNLLAEVAEALEEATQPPEHPLRPLAERLARFRRLTKPTEV